MFLRLVIFIHSKCEKYILKRLDYIRHYDFLDSDLESLDSDFWSDYE